MATLNSNALCSLADVKESLNLVSSDHSKDNLIIRKINQASQAIENYCDRSFHAADYIEEINGSNTDELSLRQRPINTLTSVEFRSGVNNVDSWNSLGTQYYFQDDNPGIVKFLGSFRGSWDAWRVTYNAGYTTIPSDLAEACADLACHYVITGGTLVNVRSKQEGQRRVDYYQGITGFHNLLVQLGLDQTIDGYANWPLISE